MFFIFTFNMVLEHDTDQTLSNTTSDENQTEETTVGISTVVDARINATMD